MIAPMRLAYRLLDIPAVYQLSQFVLAPGAKQALRRATGGVLEELPPAERILEIGSGPESRLWEFGLEPYGIDISREYAESYSRRDGLGAAASATQLPFADRSFDGVWSFALLHHLPDELAAVVVDQALRVTRPGGYTVIFDTVLPEPAWRRPAAWTIQKLDRGRFMRKRARLEGVLGRRDWKIQPLRFSLFRYEGLYCILRPDGADRAASDGSGGAAPTSPNPATAE